MSQSPVGYLWSEIPEVHKRNGIWAAIPIGRKPLTADLEYDLVLVSGAEQSKGPYIPRVAVVGSTDPELQFMKPDEFVFLRRLASYSNCAVEMFDEIRGVVPSGYPKSAEGSVIHGAYFVTTNDKTGFIDIEPIDLEKEYGSNTKSFRTYDDAVKFAQGWIDKQLPKIDRDNKNLNRIREIIQKHGMPLEAFSNKEVLTGPVTQWLTKELLEQLGTLLHELREAKQRLQ